MSWPEQTDKQNITIQDAEGIETPLTQKYARFTERYPQIGIHLSAVDHVGSFRRVHRLNNFKREALLIYSLWTEDPVSAIEIANNVGISEDRVNQYLELVSSRMGHLSDTMLDVVVDLRKKAEQTLVADVMPEDHLAGLTPVARPTPSRDRWMAYGDVENVPLHGTLAQTYDHPIPTREQEVLLFEHLERGSTLEVLMQDDRLNASIVGEDLERSWGKVLAESETVQDVIINTTLRFVDVIARAYRNRGVSHQDLVNAGNIGAVRALEKYNPAGPARFVGYAKYVIRNEIVKAVRDAEEIKIPAQIRGDLGIVFWVKDAFQSVFGRDPTIEELRTQLLANTDLSVSRINDTLDFLQSNIQHVESIHRTITPDSEDEVADFIPDKTVDIEEGIIATESRGELRKDVHRALYEYLTESERRVIIELFGIGNEIEKGPEEVAQITGLMQDTINTIRDRAIARLRHDERLRAHWDGKTDIPSFVYRHISAERAAFRLGLFSEKYMEMERLKRPLLQQAAGTVVDQQSQTEVIEEAAVAEQTSSQEANVDQWNLKTTSEKTVILLNQGLTRQEVADRLGIKTTSLAAKLSKLRKKGFLILREPTEYIDEIDEQIKGLHKQGRSYSEIASAVSRTKTTVGQRIRRLIALGEIEPFKVITRDDVKQAATSEETELVRKYLEGHPRPKYEDGFRRIFGARYRQRNGQRSPETVEFDRSVKELLEQGFPRRKIAEELVVPISTIDSSVHRMIVIGEYTAGASASSKSVEERNKYNAKCERIIELFQEGLNILEVAEAIDGSLERTQIITRSLTKKGKINPSVDQLKPAGRMGYVDKNTNVPAGRLQEVYQRVAEMRQNGFGNSEIAAALNKPVHRIGIYASRLIRAGVIQPRLGGVRNPKAGSKPSLQNTDFKPEAISISQEANEIQIPGDQVGVTVETQTISPEIDTQSTDGHEPLPSQLTNKEENITEVSDANQLGEATIHPRNDYTQREAVEFDIPIKVPKGAKPFYTVKDISDELEVPSHVVKNILKEIGVTRAKAPWRLTPGNVSSQKRVPLHFTYREYLIVKERVQRSTGDKSKSNKKKAN